MYDFYALGDAPNAVKSSINLTDLVGSPHSNGMWDYSDAAETFIVKDWHPGIFTTVFNAETSHNFNGSTTGVFDGTSDAYPASTWGNTQLQPCLPISFQRLEGSAAACADEKDAITMGRNVTAKELNWCSDEFETEIVKHRRTIWGTGETYDTIVIPQTWTVHFNCDKPVTIKALELHGKLIFKPGGPRTLTATHIFVSHDGKLQAGTAESPFPDTVQILLAGHRRTPHWPASDLGNKFLVSTGAVELYGLPKRTWSRLATTAPAGARTLELEQDLELQAGDVVIVTASKAKNETERAEVESASGTTVTLKSALAHVHPGVEATSEGRPETRGLLATEVAVIRGSIVIEGLDTPGFGGKGAITAEKWGAVVKIFSLKEKCLVSEGVLHMQGVEIRKCGRDIMPCLNIDSEGTSSVKDSVVWDGLGDGFAGGFPAIKASPTTTLEGNLVYLVPKGHGIETEGVGRRNLVTYCGYGYKYSGAGEFHDNVASGIGNFAEFKKPGGVCAFVTMSSPGTFKSEGNVMRGCQNGVVAAGGTTGRCRRDLPTLAAYPTTTSCSIVSGITMLHITQLGLRVDRVGRSVVVSGITFINAGKGVSMAGTGADSKSHSTAKPDIHLEVRNCTFFTEAGRCSDVGVNAATFYNAWLRLHRPLLAPSLYGGTVVENVAFYGFGQCSPALTNDVQGGWPVALHDGAHYAMFTSGLKFYGGAETMRVKFHNSEEQCVQMQCDGRRSSILVDTDGSLLGSRGTVVARSENGFEHKLLPHSFRYDADGNTIPQSKLYEGPGIFREGCTLDNEWNAWRCVGGRHRHLIIESMDPDWLDRRYAPVAVEVNAKSASYGGYVALYTGPGTPNTGMVQAFWTVASVGERHNVYFSSTNPGRTRLHLRDVGPNEGIVVSVYYGQPNRVEVYKKGKRVQMLAEPTWDDRSLVSTLGRFLFTFGCFFVAT